MEDETFVSEPNALNESPVVDSQDEFASIREHFEAGIQLTDAEMNKIADTAVFYLRELLSFFGENSCAIDEYDGEDGELILDVTGGDLAILIGRHGNTLEALQMVLSSLMSAKKTGKVSLAPMSGYERRIIHIALRDNLEVTTHSEGDDPYRRVVVTAINS